MKQLSEKQAIAFYNSNVWQDMTEEQIVKCQLFQDRVCMPFDVFHKAISKVLNRSIWTHEFAFREKLIEEYLGQREAPTFEQILGLIPSDKRILIIKP